MKINSYVIKIFMGKQSLGFVTACDGDRITVSKDSKLEALCFLRQDANKSIKTLPECCDGKIIPVSKLIDLEG